MEPNRWKLVAARPLIPFLAVLLVFEFLAAESITSSSIVIDEFAHLPAGVAYWQRGLFSMYDENPPLARFLISAPACVMGARMDDARVGGEPRWEWRASHDFRRANRDSYLTMFAWGRFVTAAAAIACGALIFRWAWLLYGSRAALACSALWFLDPNTLAHATIATTDVITTAVGLLATYWFWKMLRCPTWMGVILSGLGLGLAMGTKFSMIMLVPIWAAMALVMGWLPRETSIGSVGRAFARLGIMAVVTLLVVNALYGFRGTPTVLGRLTFTSPLLSGTPHTVHGDLLGNRFDGTWLGKLPIPLPRTYLIGLDSQLQEQQDGRFANLSDGQLIVGGRWYSPIRTLLLKMPMGSLLAIAAAAVYWARGARRVPRGEAVIWIAPLALIGLFCTLGGGLNFAYRYILPALPFLLIVAGRMIGRACDSRLGRVAVCSCLLWNVTSVIVTRPSYLCFGNELVGGSAGAQRQFLGSNYDWGQDLFRLKRWADDHPEARPLAIAYYGPIGPGELSIPTSQLPRSFYQEPAEALSNGPARDFYWAISSNALYGLPSVISGDNGAANLGIIRSARLRPNSAISQVGGSIYIFHIGPQGGPPSPGCIPAEGLAGCVHRFTSEDITGTP